MEEDTDASSDPAELDGMISSATLVEDITEEGADVEEDTIASDTAAAVDDELETDDCGDDDTEVAAGASILSSSSVLMLLKLEVNWIQMGPRLPLLLKMQQTVTQKWMRCLTMAL